MPLPTHAAIYKPVRLTAADSISPGVGAELIGISRSDMYRLIRALERYVDRESGEIRDLPRAYHASPDQRARNAWRRQHTVVIPEWGAESLAHADWRISRMHLLASVQAHRASIPELLNSTVDQRRSSLYD